MLSSFERDIISIIKASLNSTTPTLSGELDYEKVYSFAKEMQIVPLLCYGLEKVPEVYNTDGGKKIVKSTLSYSFFDEGQMAEIDKIIEAFDLEKIEYVKLKGTVIKKLYPRSDMRLMSDADILIKEESYPKIKKIMTSLGFEEELESDHEYVFTKGKDLNIELHKRLIPSYNKDYYEYFGDGWRLAKPSDKGSEWKMSNEDFFIYTFVHYAKHYRDGGIGVKHLTDFYLYITKVEIDWNYVEEELEKLQLLRFWKNTKKLIDVWFFDGECDEISEFLTHKLFSGSAYGTGEAHLLSEGLKISKKTKNVRAKRFFTSVFPPYSTMKQGYKYLAKLPILLPFTWTFRWIEIIFHPKRFIQQRRKLKMLSSENISAYKNELDYVGIDFNFE